MMNVQVFSLEMELQRRDIMNSFELNLDKCDFFSVLICPGHRERTFFCVCSGKEASSIVRLKLGLL